MRLNRMLTVVLLIATAAALPLTASAADQEPKPNQDQRMVVFPLDGVNVPQHILDASAELLPSAMVGAGFVVASWKKGYRQATGSDPQENESPPPQPAASSETADDKQVKLVVNVNNVINLPEASGEGEGEGEDEPGSEGFVGMTFR